jgi:ubiquinone/menaquinone biosynthesis C-methylase UbiE
MEMSFGYMPHKNVWKDLILKILGYPSVIRRVQAPIILEMLELKKDDMVLDAGCGRGFFTYEIGKRCKMSIGIDWILSEDLSFAMSKRSNVSFIKGDVQKLPLASRKFDKILLSSVLQMVEDDRALLKECRRVLKKEGILVLSVPVEYHYIKRLNSLKPQLKKRFGALGKAYYSLNEVVELLRSEGFKIMKIEYSPKKWGSLIFEIGLFFWYYLHFPLFSPILFPILYPIAYFDRFATRDQIGDEVCIKARKVKDE